MAVGLVDFDVCRMTSRGMKGRRLTDLFLDEYKWIIMFRGSGHCV